MCQCSSQSWMVLFSLKLLWDIERNNSLYKTNVEYALRLEDCILNESSLDGVFHSDLRQPRCGSYGLLLDKLEWFWEIKLWPIISKVLGVLFGLLSIIIIMSEGSLGLPSTYDKSVFHFFKNLSSGTYAHAMVHTLLLMGYLCFCTFYGIFNFKVSGFYGLYPYHQTEPSNLVYSALYLAKLAAPLCVNFLMLIHFENNQSTIFDKVAGRGMSWSFVNSFLKYFPCLIVVLCLLYYFEVYSKVMKSLGLDEYTYYNFYDPEQLEAGVDVLKRERIKALQEKGMSPRRAALKAAEQKVSFWLSNLSFNRNEGLCSQRASSKTTFHNYAYSYTYIHFLIFYGVIYTGIQLLDNSRKFLISKIVPYSLTKVNYSSAPMRFTSRLRKSWGTNFSTFPSM